MRIGLNAGALRSIAKDAKAAEERGFDYFGCGEHIFFLGETPNGFIALAAAASVTNRIRLVSSITLLPLYPPALAAKLAATLDVVSDGRFELGVGAGGEFPPEFEAVGVDLATRFRRLDEGLRVMRALFTGQGAGFSGEYTSLPDVALNPPPVQPGGPPIWVAGRKAGSARRAGRHGDVWLPYLLDAESVATRLAQARDAAEQAGRARHAVSGGLYLWICADSDDGWARETGIATVSNSYRQDFGSHADDWLAVGSADQVIERLKAYEAAGVERVLLQIAAPPESRDRVADTLAAHVLPVFRD